MSSTDLYGDITLDDQVENLEFKEKYSKVKEEFEANLKELESAKDTATQLEESNKILERNICCLYETAKKEVERKNAIIADMRQQLDEKAVALKEIEFKYGQLKKQLDQQTWAARKN